jgi:hypothetical protein
MSGVSVPLLSLKYPSILRITVIVEESDFEASTVEAAVIV